MFDEKVEANLRRNAKELKERKDFLTSYPIKIYVEPTQRCNLNCVMCCPERRAARDDMTMDLFRKIERECFPYVAEVDFFLTGEPTIAKNFVEMIKTCSQYTFLPKVFTNAAALPEEIIRLFVELGFFVNVSIDASSKKIFEDIRRGSDFNRVIANVREMARLNESIKNRRFHIRFAATVGSDNVEEAPGIVELAHGLGIRDTMFGALDSIWGNRAPLKDNYEKSSHYLLKAKELADKYRIRFSCPKRIGVQTIEHNHNWDDFGLDIDDYAPFQLEEDNPYKGKCGYPWIQTAFRSDGAVASCCQREIIMGNFKQDSFWDIWNGDRYRLMRDQESFYKCLGNWCNMAVYSIWKGGGDGKEDRDVPKYPLELPGTFWGLATYFNPLGYKNKLEHYRRFRAHAERQGLKLLTVELAFGGDNFELGKEDADRLIQIRTNSRVYWQKERLLNIGLGRLPEDCDKIAWVDTDIRFLNDNWLEETAKLLETYIVVQPYSQAVFLPKDVYELNPEPLPFGIVEGHKMHGAGYGTSHFGRDTLSDNFMIYGHTGHAWSARRSVFDKHGFYDRNILVTSDKLMAHAFFGSKSRTKKWVHSELLMADEDEWIDGVYRDVRGSVFYTDGFLYHFWHGAHKDRCYKFTADLLHKYRFDPRRDIKMDKQGLWQWSSFKPGLHKGVRRYFEMRKEQG